ncbi:CDP-glycerol glycerophosphotransferase family protein [Caminibacter pacificus]|uniref:CDP-glycerol:poly(Glycerophosphate) glycerophosphotransferase n=1 Tax=Caminibacter pacificus TaxID=1424653 RepID=A0AAJ4RBF1_9BACT|nr:CDP-glycerol glycerophosphotransferase family protein [Caminibacter pacificus]QCI29081.1 hypothetical protein C6V80_08950 [Caminibacter pacificus]ROR39098.1 CDP-glycerol:poly(glycerophosphate) glycerophosphotransferase [Caminibacter pacificus]
MLFKNKKSLNINNEIIIYFAGNKKQLYQLYQWERVFEYINQYIKIGIVFSNDRTYKYVKKNNLFHSFTKYFIKDKEELIKAYNASKSLKIILYLNNNIKNFLSLIHNKAFHIHIGHGESEKDSSISNQINAYDYVFVSGKASIDRFKKNFLNYSYNKHKYIEIGRPVLDFIKPIKIENLNNKKVVLYAPTWEGSLEFMNYSSLEYGKEILKFFINKKYFIIYKPHPLIGSRNKKYKKIQKDIMKFLKDYKYSYVHDKNVLDVFPLIDFAIFDNSSIIIDYLSFEKPYIITNFGNKSSNILMEKSVVLNRLNELNSKVDFNMKPNRYLKEYYLGCFDYSNQEATKYFLEKLFLLKGKV